MQRIIFHIDMNAYFASVACAVNPSFKNKPLIIGTDAPRGIVSTASYEARKLGIHSAMPVYQAKKLCKDLIIVNPDFGLYEKYTFLFLQIIKRHSKEIEVASIDECFVDFTNIAKDFDEAYKIASNIQYSILNELDLPCSIGVSYNKFLAKMASDLKKPLGITVIKNNQIKEKLWPLKIDDMFGVGKKTSVKLKEINIFTIKDLATYKDLDKLAEILGKSTNEYIKLANGIDYSVVHTENPELKSVGHSRTFSIDTDDIEILKDKLKELTGMVSERAKDGLLVGDTIQITIRNSNFETITRSKKINQFTNDLNTMYRVVLELFNKHYKKEKVRLLGVALENTHKMTDNDFQMTIYDLENPTVEHEISQTRKLINELNKQAGNKLFKTAREIK